MRARNCKLSDPLAPEGRSADGEPAAGQHRGKPGVLVVDDDYLVRLLVQLGLERNGFEVWLAASGREALPLYQKHRERVAVVLLDVCMPGLDGPQTLEGLRALNPTVRACFMSGNPGVYESEELRQCGAASIIAKPFRMEDLANVLRRVVQGEPADPLPAGGICLE
jgi:CheY-like chemotaxis protein